MNAYGYQPTCRQFMTSSNRINPPFRSTLAVEGGMMLNQGVSNGGKYEMEEIGRLSY
jgi:hypothetical protein